MSERIQHPTTADVREHLDRIEEVIGGIRAYLCMFDARPEHGISDRIVKAFREIQVDSGGGARCQQAVAAWATELSAAVGADVAALPEQGDLLAPPPFDGLMGIFGATAEIEAGRDAHEDWDEWLEDWHGPSSKLPDRDGIRADHPFPIDPDEEVQW
ncbi:hypothetical protein [Nocardiopsis dassonvillei]|uniref:hypothetical protein n=1 Tax=Nocardiopsis dassonvillei TaxID=2014 RepID=UPI00157E04D7|nr:hypothetical protein [Nocardiopsis dassonvillei]